MSGEDMRHSYHELDELVESRVVLPDDRIVEADSTDPPENPPNVIRGNNADLPE